MPELFTRFYRAPNVDAWHISGIGLGLYVVKEIVTLHGGTIEVASSEGAGSTFTGRLPLAGAIDPDGSDQDAPRGPARGRRTQPGGVAQLSRAGSRR
jgi:signal transduction histidine kinase